MVLAAGVANMHFPCRHKAPRDRQGFFAVLGSAPEGMGGYHEPVQITTEATPLCLSRKPAQSLDGRLGPTADGSLYLGCARL